MSDFRVNTLPSRFGESASLIGIISQRLLRRVYSHCREPYRPEEREPGRFGLRASRKADVTFYRAHHRGPNEQVCPHCQGSG